MKKTFLWDKEQGIASCIIYYKNMQFKGTAICHPEDKDFESEKTGCNIAEMRAEIKYLQHIKNNELRPAYEALNHLLCCMRTNKNYNPKSYEASMVRRQLRLKQQELATAQQELTVLQQDLKAYIDAKDIFYRRIRKAKA